MAVTLMATLTKFSNTGHLLSQNKKLKNGEIKIKPI